MQVADRRTEAVRMRQNGASTEEIRKALGYKNAGTVRRHLREASASVVLPKPERRRHPCEDDGLPVDVLTSRDRRVRRMIEQQARRRHERLEGLLRASGLHVSQMTAAQLGSRVWSLEQYDG